MTAKTKTWVVDLTGFGNVVTIKVEASDEAEAKEKALAQFGITVEVRGKARPQR
jgi:hypothetical protein